MKLIIGLGNPGKEYENNRHNAGFMFIDYLLKGGSELPADFKAFKTEKVYMNDSGRFVAEKVNFFKVKAEDLFVVHDELDLPFGQFKIQFGVGPKVHNGLSSIENMIGTKEFWRVRIGTDSRVRGEGKLGDSGHDFVLDDFTPDEIMQLNNIFPKILSEILKKI